MAAKKLKTKGSGAIPRDPIQREEWLNAHAQPIVKGGEPVGMAHVILSAGNQSVTAKREDAQSCAVELLRKKFNLPPPPFRVTQPMAYATG